MNTSRITIYAIAATVVAFVAQSMWESPLVVFVYHITYLGGRTASAMRLKPGWGFDVVAITINAATYLVLILFLDVLVRRHKGVRKSCIH